MMAAQYERRDSMAPALLAALALHVALFLALVAFPHAAILPMGDSVPINIVASGPTTNSRPAEQAPVTQDARTETPVPEAKAPSPPPAPSQPQVKPTPPKPAPAKPEKSAFSLSAVQADISAKQSLNLNALQAELRTASRNQPVRPAFARQGPSRAETAPQARVDAGTGVSQSDIAGLSQLLERLWNPDCSVDNRVVIPVRFTVGFDGHLQGPVDAGGRASSPDPVVFAAARRAIDAVHQAAPYADTYRGLTITVRFDAAKACAQRN